MEGNKILSKLNIDMRNYNNELEKVLENKLFSYDVKNLLLSMLYKIENGYRDYETVKIEVPSKREYIEKLLRIIKEKCLKIFLVKAGTPEVKELEKNNLLFKVDKKNGEIICFQNEFVILTALLNLDIIHDTIEIPYNYIEKPLMSLLELGQIDSNVEVIRDFNGWSWDIDVKRINNIECNMVYQTLLLLNGVNGLEYKKSRKLFDLISIIALKKYLTEKQDTEFNEKFIKLKEEKINRLQLFDNKKEFINKITEEKWDYTKQIEQIDKLLNNNELLKKEYYSRNKDLPNKEKIFSISYLVKIIDKEREELMAKIDECNKLLLPSKFVKQKSKLEEEVRFLNAISETNKDIALKELVIEFLEQAKNIILNLNEESKEKLISWIYKIRYYRYIPIDENLYVKDIETLKLKFEEIIRVIIIIFQ